MQMTFYNADCTGNAKNCRYPHKRTVTNELEFMEVVRKDHVCAEYRDCHRGSDRFIVSDVVVMDCDNDHSDKPEEWTTMDELERILAGVAYAIAPSRNHMVEKDGKVARPKFHVYFPIREVTDAKEYAGLKRRIYKKYPFFDGNALDAGRFIFGAEVGMAMWHKGDMTIDAEVPEMEKDSDEWEEKFERQIFEGSRNSTMSRFAGRVLKRYGNTEEAQEAFLEYAEKCTPPLPEEELRTIWVSALKFYEEKILTQDDYISPEDYVGNEFCSRGNNGSEPGSLEPDDYSDIGQAEVLVREYGSELRFNLATKYLRYDGIRWTENRTIAVGAVEEFLGFQLRDARKILGMRKKRALEVGVDVDLVKARGSKAVNALNEKQLAAYQAVLDAEKYLSFVIKRRNYRNMEACMRAAEPMVYIEYDQLDKDPFLMNTPGGTYDLRKGWKDRREHRAEDYLMKVTAVDPGEKGKEMWEQALMDTFLGDKELIDYVQEVVGLTAIGKVFVEALIIAYGEGKNGKSTFWNTISRVLGLYGGSMASDVLTAGCRRNVAPEKAELKGKRLVIAAELDEGMRLNTGVVKQLCSTDMVRGEKKFKDPADFMPSHQLVLYTNHLPRVGASDAGTWRRLVVIPFNATFEAKEDQKDFAERLFEEAGPAILAWIMAGAERIIKKKYKLERPECVKQAIIKYRKDNDWLGNFLDECCEIDESYCERSGELYAHYRNYAERMGDFKRSNADFVVALENAGFYRKKTNKGAIIRGLRIREVEVCEDLSEFKEIEE